MKKQFRGNVSQLRFDGRHRRLMFERCEERLPLSGTPVLPVDASPLEGGFISLDAGDYLSTASNNFLDADSGESLFSFDRTAILTISGANIDLDAWYSLNSIPTSVVGGELTVLRVNDVMGVPLDFDFNLFSADEAVLSSTDIAGENGSIGIVADGGSENILVDAVGDRLGFEPSGASTDTTSRETTDADLSRHVGSSEVVVDDWRSTTEAVEVLAADADRFELPNRKGDEAFTNSAEGGPIEVAQAVVETQQAFEAQVFSSVAALLDEQDHLAQPTAPVGQPLSSELARSVAFETVGLEPTVDSAPFEDSQASSADISASAAVVDVKEADSEPSRALALAQWPLVFSATMGAILVGSRRFGQSRAAQLPPRRNR
jgi:hypothetical protein